MKKTMEHIRSKIRNLYFQKILQKNIIVKKKLEIIVKITKIQKKDIIDFIEKNIKKDTFYFYI